MERHSDAGNRPEAGPGSGAGAETLAPPTGLGAVRHRRARLWLAVGVVLFALVLAVPPPEGMAAPAWRTAAVGVLMAVLWVSEALPLAVTALLPLVLFPLMGVLPAWATL